MMLRPARLSDADVLLEWRNDPQTRMASHNTSVVNRADHVSWLERTLSSSERRLFIAEHQGSAVGTVRADSAPNGATEISWTVSPEFRGKGLSHQMLQALLPHLSGTIFAEVKLENVASQKVAAKAGMYIADRRDGIFVYRLDLAEQSAQ